MTAAVSASEPGFVSGVGSALRPTSATAAPSAASRHAIPAPIPRLAPVTIATRPAHRCSTPGRLGAGTGSLGSLGSGTLALTMAPLSVRLLPDPDQHDLLAATLERVNKASNLARTRALEQHVTGKAALRTVVKEEL